MSDKNGGAAFPGTAYYIDPENDKSGSYLHGGMSLRDYFAASALHGLLANPNLKVSAAEVIAADLYVIADAMLKERAK